MLTVRAPTTSGCCFAWPARESTAAAFMRHQEATHQVLAGQPVVLEVRQLFEVRVRFLVTSHLCVASRVIIPEPDPQTT